MSASGQLDQDIWYLILDDLSAQTRYGSRSSKQEAKATLSSLRLTNQFLALAAAPHLLWRIKVDKFETASLERLKVLLQSPETCQVVKQYELKPHIITSRQGEFAHSAYHKIPPYLDYGRNSSSPIIQAENRKLRQAEAHFGQQYQIIYPSKHKAVAALKGAFKWSSTRGEAGLKDSIYFTALSAFSNLESLVVSYPPPEDSSLIRTVGNEFSIALARFLAQKPKNLNSLQLSSITPVDLTTLAYSMSGADTHQSPPNFTLNISKLNISMRSKLDYNKISLHRFPDTGNSLARLLRHVPRLEELSVEYSVEDAGKVAQDFAHLSLSPFKSPQLPQLRTLALRGLAVSSEELLEIVTSSPSRLTVLTLESVALINSSWAHVLRTFAQSDTLEYVMQAGDVKNMCYRDIAAPTWRRPWTDDDRKAQLEWETKIDERVVGLVKKTATSFSVNRENSYLPHLIGWTPN